jgi:hypothetical protein
MKTVLSTFVWAGNALLMSIVAQGRSVPLDLNQNVQSGIKQR